MFVECILRGIFWVHGVAIQRCGGLETTSDYVTYRLHKVFMIFYAYHYHYSHLSYVPMYGQIFKIIK